MNYLVNIVLPCREYKHPLEMYPNTEQSDLVDAVYREVNSEKSNPDICALPPLLEGTDLIAANIQTFPGYNREKIRRMPKSERLSSLASCKNKVKVYLPFQAELERRVYDCLISAYSTRRYGYFGSLEGMVAGSIELLSVSNEIDTSVQDASLVGIAGTGKSTAIQMLMSRFPRALRHTVCGFSYIQIPILAVVAYKGTDMKNIYLTLAQKIDRIIGFESYYERQMLKQSTVAKMQSYMIKLIGIFHIGMLIIDEIQLALQYSSSLFQQMLTITAAAGVSVLVVGTDDAIAGLNKDAWFSRRFSQLGRICADIPFNDETVMKAIATTIWSCQWTLKDFPPTPKALDALIEVSGNNVDLLSTVYITAQFMVIQSEGTNNELELNASLVRKAAARYPFAKKLILDGRSVLEDMYNIEKASAINAINSAAQIEKQLEQREMMRHSTKLFTKMQSMETMIYDRVAICGYTDQKAIGKIIRQLLAQNSGFQGMDIAQQTKSVIAELMKQEAKMLTKEKGKGKKTSDSGHAAIHETDTGRNLTCNPNADGAIGHDDKDPRGIELLQTIVS